MRGLRKSKRVSWASDVNLCQVRLFLSDESPSLVGLGGQDHLQAKASWSLHSTGLGSDDNLPPGFEGIQPSNLLKNKLSQIPLVKWKCPSRFVLNYVWQVVAGEESKEIEVENQREMRVLEAVYPRPSAIPQNPAFLIGVEDSYHNDQHTPLIPITPVEDEDGVAGSSYDDDSVVNTQSISAQMQLTAPLDQASQGITSLHEFNNHQANMGMFPPAVEPEFVKAAYSALSSAMTNSDQIDPNLLVQILSNPQLIEKLVAAHAVSSAPVQIAPVVSTSTAPGPIHGNVSHGSFAVGPSSSGTYYPPSNRMGSIPVPVPVPNLRPPHPLPPEVIAPVKKDINYYKSLIQQHGGEKVEPANINPNPRDMKHKIMKPCIYFNSSRGCRHGANCVYQHDSSSLQRVSSLPEAQTAKRMKMDREITGT